MLSTIQDHVPVYVQLCVRPIYNGNISEILKHSLTLYPFSWAQFLIDSFIGILGNVANDNNTNIIIRYMPKYRLVFGMYQIHCLNHCGCDKWAMLMTLF